MRAGTATITLALSLILLTACGDDDSDDSAPAGAEGFPLTLENCGETVTIDEPPKRVVTIHQHATEALLALGAGNRMVGTAYPDNPILRQYQPIFEQVPQIAEQQPSFEDVLEAEPDLVYGGYGSAFSENSGTSRKAFEEAGIDTYLNSENCTNGPISMDAGYGELRNLGTIFGASERAELLIQDMQTTIAGVQEKVAGAEPKQVFVYDSGEDAAFTAGGKGIGNEIIKLSGGTNIFGDIDDVFAGASWEQVVARRPDVIVIYDRFGSGTVEDKRRFLQEKLRDVPAVENGQFFVLPRTAMVVGVRPADAVQQLAPVLHPDRFRP